MLNKCQIRKSKDGEVWLQQKLFFGFFVVVVFKSEVVIKMSKI